MRFFENNNPIDMNIPYKLAKFLLNLTAETLAGRVEKEGGSFDWKNGKNLKEWGAIIPTHGNFAGLGYSCGKRGEFSLKEIKEYPVARIFDSKLGENRDDYVDILAKIHDQAYAAAKGQPDYWERIHAADLELIRETQKLLDGTSPLFSDGGKMTLGETAYAKSMLDGFKIKLVMMDQLPASIEQIINAGYGKKEINDCLNNISQGLYFLNPRDVLRKLNLSENEIREIEQKVAAESRLDGEAIQQSSVSAPKADNVQITSSTNQYQDDYEDEDQNYRYGPGMGMG